MKGYHISVSPGTQLEGRIQRLLFHQGYFAVRDIFIPSHSQAPGASTPDMDVLGYTLTEDFHITKAVYDCKSGASQAVNRILWLQTVARRINADRVYLVRNKTKQAVKFYGLAEGVYFIDFDTLDMMEQAYMTSLPVINGSTTSEFLAATEELKRVRKNPDVERAIQVINTEFWFLPSCAALKKVVAQYERICPASTIPVLSDISLQWLKAMLVGLFTLGVLRICGEVVSLSPREREELLRQRLVSDRIPYSEFASLVKTTFEYAHSVYGKQAALPLGDYYVVPPPKYTDSLLDLITRALKRPREAILMPRFSECVLFEYVLLGKTVDQAKMEQLFRRPYADLLAHYRDYLFFLDAICPATREFLKTLFP
jgi:hypothetical protein